jgi:hypothetical protein
MIKRVTFLLSALLLLVLANVLMMTYASPVFVPSAEGFAAKMVDASENKVETFSNYSGNPGGAKDTYQPIGAFDGVKLQASPESRWRYTKPNEPLNGYFPKFQPGPDNLFMFKDNQAKPECCGASYSSDMGCVCTTPDQRDFINKRGGNRSAGGDPDM